MNAKTKLTIDDLWSIVFQKLSIKELINCRLVNKKFKNLIDHSNCISKLIIGEADLRIDDYYWIYNNRPIEDKDIISLKCFRTIKELSIFNLDTNLKYLKIYDPQFKLEEILSLINLESIEFGRYYQNHTNNQQILNFNNLKVFVSGSISIQLNTPKLEKYKFSQIKLNSNPESIKHLITSRYDNRLEIFKNLEIMELRNINFMDFINENILITFKNLKQLKINMLLVKFYSDEIIKNCLIKVLNDKTKLKREFDIYLEGIKIENINKFNELANVGKNSIWKFVLNNYDLLDLNLPFIGHLNYDELEECVNNLKNNLPSSFFDKFFNINVVYVYKKPDVNNLSWLLDNLKYLIRLQISNDIGNDVSFGQHFYNNLPNTIRILYIHINEDINYEFILRLSKLTCFRTYVDKDLFNLVFTSFLNLKYLNDFRFDFKNKEIIIQKRRNCFYFSPKRIKIIDYNQLVNECNDFRSRFN